MEITKQDKHHIDEEVRLMTLRMKEESTEYATLCKLYYLEAIKKKVEDELESIHLYHNSLKNVYNR